MTLCLPGTSPASADIARLRPLSDGERAAIHGTAATLFLVSRLVRERDTGPVPEDYRINAIDRGIRDLLRRDDGKTGNFLDNRRGSAVAPSTAAAIMAVMDIDRREFGRDLPFFLSGVLTTKALTDVTKNTIRRPRPCCLNGNCPEGASHNDDLSHGHSFFSGHASSAFYAATFLNLRLRREMRIKWTVDEYRVGRVASPILCFGWASFVGLSRIHADRHFFTDVLAGAATGALVAEVFYRLAYDHPEDPAGAGAPVLTIRIPLN